MRSCEKIIIFPRASFSYKKNNYFPTTNKQQLNEFSYSNIHTAFKHPASKYANEREK